MLNPAMLKQEYTHIQKLCLQTSCQNLFKVVISLLYSHCLQPQPQQGRGSKNTGRADQSERTGPFLKTLKLSFKTERE